PDPRQSRRRAPLDSLVPHAGPRASRSGQVSPPQLRGGGPQRPVRHPSPRWVLLRGALRPSTPGHRRPDQLALRGGDRQGLRGDQARMGAGQLQLLHRRGGVPLHRRGRPPGGGDGLETTAPVPLRRGNGRLAPPIRFSGAASHPGRLSRRGSPPPPSRAGGATGGLSRHRPQAAGERPADGSSRRCPPRLVRVSPLVPSPLRGRLTHRRFAASRGWYGPTNSPGGGTQMPHSIREIMTTDPVSVPESMNIIQVAEIMRDSDIGDVIVSDGGGVVGIVTDRDLVVRGLASGNGVDMLSAGDLASRDIQTVGPDDPAARAVEVMRDRAIRRLPVLDNGELVGVVSLGDLAMERDPDSALGDISEAPPNN